MSETKEAPEGAVAEWRLSDWQQRNRNLQIRLWTEQVDLLLDWNLTAKTDAEIEQARNNIVVASKLIQHLSYPLEC